MFGRPPAIQITCDAPPYPIVRACRSIGLRSPEDVRWCRLGEFRKSPHGRLDLFNLWTWKVFLGLRELDNSTCSCGQGLPPLEKYVFTLINGREMEYLIGQCGRCRTIFWEQG